MLTKTYAGLLSLGEYGEADDVLFLSTIDIPFAEELQEIAGHCVTMRYWISPMQLTKDEAQEQFMRTLYGQSEGDFGARYSEWTGYLWTTEKLQVGGHDVIEELKSHVGKWLILEVDIHDIVAP